MITNAIVSTLEETQPSSETRVVQHIAAAVASRILGQCPHIVRAGSAVAEIILLRVPVLLVGAPGAGKRFFARMTHELGSLSARPFVVLACGDSTLDAEKLRRIVESAAQATLFIDAIDRLSLELQDVLYKCAFVEEGALPARVLACCERLLDSDVSDGHFRHELFDMFATNVIYVPSLHDRSDDMSELVEYFFGMYAAQARRTDLRGLSPEAQAALKSHTFFDNVRGLEYAIEHAIAFAQGPYVTVADLPTAMRKPEPVEMTQFLRALPANGVDLKNAVESFETLMILQALERTGWNKNRAAQLLGLNRTTLVEMIKRKRLVPPAGLRRAAGRDSAPGQELAAE
jgi:DNA-binding NtrC family response regulator